MDLIKVVMDTLANRRPSTIEFLNSGSREATGGEEFTGGISVQEIQLRDNSNGTVEWLDFTGFGAGVGFGTPVGASISTPEMPGTQASKVLRGTTNLIFALELGDLTGKSQIWSFSAAYLGGVSASLIFFGAPVPPPVPPAVFKAALWVTGSCIASPGIGCMTYYGEWKMRS